MNCWTKLFQTRRQWQNTSLSEYLSPQWFVPFMGFSFVFAHHCFARFRVFDMMKVEEDVERELRNEFVLQQLLGLAGVLDLSDEVGRCVSSACHRLVPSVLAQNTKHGNTLSESTSLRIAGGTLTSW